ncbi:NACHT domain-containing protein [Thermoflavimicrobium daqui]|uniref:Uncharacterized protein n=1 Tax=Thermoflavimicrobium daqui TaxID=2137476 RepID=A0A364K183_9BACL|nr:NACHT domain-containing protein [Thermoflavimicrobium daqui]RAL21447.1 hypothetical protein DL897_15945 [Thermoflavimicrobium daqui]
MTDLNHIFRSGKEVFEKYLTEYLIDDHQYKGLLSQLDSILLLGDRVVQACKYHPNLKEIHDFFWFLSRIYTKSGRTHANIERVLAKLEIWLKTIYYFIHQGEQNELAGVTENGSLAMLYHKLQLLTNDELYSEIEIDLAREESSCDVKKLMMIARLIRNRQTHYPCSPPKDWNQLMLPATLIVILAPLYKKYEALQASLSTLTVRDLQWDELFHVFLKMKRERKEHLRFFQGREDAIQEVKEIVYEKKRNHGMYILVTGVAGIGKTALCCQLTEDILPINYWRIHHGKDQEFAPWLPSSLFFMGNRSISPAQMIRCLTMQANTLLLETIPLMDSDPLGVDIYEQKKKWLTVLRQLTKERGNILVILDGIDPVISDPSWLAIFPEELPAGVTILVTTQMHSMLGDWLTKERRSYTIHLTELSKKETAAIIGLEEEDHEVDFLWEETRGWPKQIMEFLRRKNQPNCFFYHPESSEKYLFGNLMKQWSPSFFPNEAKIILKEIKQLLLTIYPAHLSLSQINSYLSFRGFQKELIEIKHILDSVKEQLTVQYPDRPFQLYLTAFINYLRKKHYSQLDFCRSVEQVANWFMRLTTEEIEQEEVSEAILLFVRKCIEQREMHIHSVRKVITKLITNLGRKKQFKLLYQIASVNQKGKTEVDDLVFYCLTLSAEAYYPPAMNQLGTYYLKGIHVSQDSNHGESLIRMAAEAKDVQAMNHLGMRLIRGDGIEQDEQQGEEWLRKAADQGFARAMSNLGDYLYTVKKEIIEAKYWFNKATKLGCPRAMYRLSTFLFKNNNKEGEKWLKRAAEAGEVHAMIAMGQYMIEGKYLSRNPEAGVTWLERAASAGSTDAMIQLVKRYFTGNGVKRDWQRGEKWLKRGANTGNEMMMLQLGKHLLKGTYVIPRIEDGLLWLEKAALKNTHCLQELIRFYIDSPREIQDINRGLELLHRWIETGQKQAMYELGRRYLRGNGLPQNLEEGEKWLEKAAYAGLSQAMNDLGNGYLDGEYLPKNSDKGIAWLEQAAEEGDTSAMYSLGKRYLFGMGLPRNIERGLFWINKAAEMGNGSAIQVLKMGLINRLR